jgi:hypothetical protein
MLRLRGKSSDCTALHVRMLTIDTQRVHHLLHTPHMACCIAHGICESETLVDDDLCQSADNMLAKQLLYAQSNAPASVSLD